MSRLSADYKSPKFRPELVANALIKDTTTTKDIELDLNPALTRLKYDLEEIELQMAELCKSNSKTLLEHSKQVASTTKSIDSLAPVVDDMQSTYLKLERDFIKPYNDVARLRVEGEKLFACANISRMLTWYLQLALQAQSQDYMRESIIASKEHGDIMLRTAKAIVNLKKMVEKCPDLLKLDAVCQFEKKLPKLENELQATAIKMVQQFSGDGTDQIKLVMNSLNVLNADLESVLVSLVRQTVSASTLQLTRSNNAATAGHLKAMNDTIERSKVINVLCELCPNQPLNGVEMYWKLMNSQLEQKMKTISVANPHTLKMFQNNREDILKNTEAVPELHSVFEKYLKVNATT